jgi:phosphoglycolate phosphatase-like HAD superfamily hydrolase
MTSLLLWDVDGTLVRTGVLGREPFQAAVAAVLGSSDVDPQLHERVQMSGKTDPQIARELLTLAAVSEDDVEHHLPEVLRRLESGLGELEARIGAEGEVLPGVPEVLERCAGAAPGTLSTVLTGNLAGNALVKLRAFGLDRWLDLRIGAYGSDHHDREELVPIARRKAAEVHGVDVRASSVWVIGDTPRDLACARAGGARCALVATGKFDRAALEAAGPDALFDDLDGLEAYRVHPDHEEAAAWLRAHSSSIVSVDFDS